MKSLTSCWKDAVSDFILRKKKIQGRKYTKQSISHSSRRQVLSQGSELLNVSLQQYVTATSVSSFEEIKFLKSSSAALQTLQYSPAN